MYLDGVQPAEFSGHPASRRHFNQSQATVTKRGQSQIVNLGDSNQSVSRSSNNIDQSAGSSDQFIISDQAEKVSYTSDPTGLDQQHQQQQQQQSEGNSQTLNRSVTLNITCFSYNFL